MEKEQITIKKPKGFWKYFMFYLIVNIVYYVKDFVSIGIVHEYNITQYLLSYQDFGFIARGFIGSILLKIIPFYPREVLYLVISSINISLIILVSIFAAMIMVNVSKHKPVVFALLLFFMTNPGSIRYLFNFVNFGRLETVSVALMFICIITIIKQWKLIYLVPVISLVMMLIYQGAVFLFIPTLVVLMLYIGIIRKSRMNIIVMIVTAVLSIAMFFIILAYGGIENQNLEQTAAVIRTRTDSKVSESYLNYEYFTGVETDMNSLFKVDKLFEKSLIALVMFLPVFFVIYYLLFSAFKNAEKRYKPVYLVLAVNSLTIVIMFFFACDYGRWFGAIILTQLTIILSMIYFKDENIYYALNVFEARIFKKVSLLYAAIVLYGSLPSFGHLNVIETAAKVNGVYNIFDLCIKRVLLLLNK